MYGTESVAPAAGGLVRRALFELDTVSVDPATRELRGPAGSVMVQPRIMQLLLELVDAGGAVVTRDVLAQRCWGGRFVAEDSLNSAVADLRKALRAVATDGLSIETVPRTGYRYLGPPPSQAIPVVPPRVADAPAAVATPYGIGRRTIIVGGVGAAALAAFGIWRAGTKPEAGAVAVLIERGSQALRAGLPDADAQGIEYLREAVARAPGDAQAWGLLALAWRGVADYGGPGQTAAAVANAEIAARRALAIDPRQSDALAALATLTPTFGDWTAAEARIRDVLTVDNGNLFALGALATLFMSTGRVADSGQILDQLVKRDPLSANRQFRRVYSLWSRGRLAEMDGAADRALQLWPRHPAVWFARFWTLAFTRRATAAQALLDDRDGRPAVPPAALDVLNVSVRALATGDARDVQAAVGANTREGRTGPGQAAGAIMVLSALGSLDAAFAIAHGLLTRRGPVVVQQRHTSAQTSITDLHHRSTMMLWTPATAALRADPRFLELCTAIGLTDYWRQARLEPDYLAGRTLRPRD